MSKFDSSIGSGVVVDVRVKVGNGISVGTGVSVALDVGIAIAVGVTVAVAIAARLAVGVTLVVGSRFGISIWVTEATGVVFTLAVTKDWVPSVSSASPDGVLTSVHDDVHRKAMRAIPKKIDGWSCPIRALHPEYDNGFKKKCCWNLLSGRCLAGVTPTFHSPQFSFPKPPLPKGRCVAFAFPGPRTTHGYTSFP